MTNLFFGKQNFVLFFVCFSGSSNISSSTSTDVLLNDPEDFDLSELILQFLDIIQNTIRPQYLPANKNVIYILLHSKQYILGKTPFFSLVKSHNLSKKFVVPRSQTHFFIFRVELYNRQHESI